MSGSLSLLNTNSFWKGRGKSIDYMWKQIYETKHKEANDSIVTVLEYAHSLVRSRFVKELWKHQHSWPTQYLFPVWMAESSFSSEGGLSADISLNQYSFEGVTKLIYPFSDLYVWIDS